MRDLLAPMYRMGDYVSASSESRPVLLLGSEVEARQVQRHLALWNRKTKIVSSSSQINGRLVNYASGIVVLNNFAATNPDWIARIEQNYRLRGGDKPGLPVVALSLQNINSEFSEIPETSRESIQLRCLEVPKRGARLLLNRYPLHRSMDPGFARGLHILIVGFDEIGKGILLNILRLAHYGLGKPQITISDEDTEACEQFMADEFPQAAEVANLRYRSSFQLYDPYDVAVSNAFVCLPDPDKAIQAARELVYRFAKDLRGSPRVYLSLERFEASAELTDWDGQLIPFSATAEVCNPSVLFGDKEDELASIIHEYYLDSINSQGRSWNATPAGQSWNQLPDSYKDASRHQGDHMRVKLAAIDCRVVKQDASGFFTFLPREVEKLSIIEHTRWSADRYVDGWRFGPQRDNRQKIHPELKPYDDLTADMKDLDRYAVRLIPALLSRQERGIKRDLLISVVNFNSVPAVGLAIANQIEELLKRISSRYPDRVLVLVVAPCDSLSRFIAGIGIDKFLTPIRLLIREPIALVRKRLEPEPWQEYLSMLARSEQNIVLDDAEQFRKWLEHRSDITIRIESEGETGTNFESGFQMLADGKYRKEVWLDPVFARTRWTFEY